VTVGILLDTVGHCSRPRSLRSVLGSSETIDERVAAEILEGPLVGIEELAERLPHARLVTSPLRTLA
jgi:hypothetical protein